MSTPTNTPLTPRTQAEAVRGVYGSNPICRYPGCGRPASREAEDHGLCPRCLIGHEIREGKHAAPAPQPAPMIVDRQRSSYGFQA